MQLTLRAATYSKVRILHRGSPTRCESYILLGLLPIPLIEPLNALLVRFTQRLGEVDSSLSDRIRRLSTLALEVLGIALLDFSTVADLVAWLEQQEVSD